MMLNNIALAIGSLSGLIVVAMCFRGAIFDKGVNSKLLITMSVIYTVSMSALIILRFFA